MKNLLTLGCSYSAVYYHPDPRWSYTWLLKEALGASNLINLSFGGNSPAGCTRLLEWYLRNPLKGLPDIIYCQVPGGNREEYYVSSEEFRHLKELSYVHTNDCLFKAKDISPESTSMPNIRNDLAFTDYEKFRRPEDKNFKNNAELVADVPWENFKVTAGTLFNMKDGFNEKWIEHFLSSEFKESFFMLSDNIINVQPSWGDTRTRDCPDMKKIIKDFHSLWVTHKHNRSQRLYTVRREMASMQYIANRYNIPIFFNTSDNIVINPVTGEFGIDAEGAVLETWDDDVTPCDPIINWNNVIKHDSITMGSKTWAGNNDNYWDNHPGRQSHENYANAIIPKVLDAL